MKVELFPRAEADIIRQFRYYLVDRDAPMTAFRFRDAVKQSLDRLKPYPRIGSLFRGSIPGHRSRPVKGFEMTRILLYRGSGYAARVENPPLAGVISGRF